MSAKFTPCWRGRPQVPRPRIQDYVLMWIVKRSRLCDNDEKFEVIRQIIRYFMPIRVLAKKVGPWFLVCTHKIREARVKGGPGQKVENPIFCRIWLSLGQNSSKKQNLVTPARPNLANSNLAFPSYNSTLPAGPESGPNDMHLLSQYTSGALLRH